MLDNIKKDYRNDIQHLRGLALVTVILFHATEKYFPLGYLGVDVFFVISGFVVTPLMLRVFTDETNRKGRLSKLRYFYLRRFNRLAPAALFMLFLSSFFVILLISPSSFKIFGEQAIGTVFFIGNYSAFRYTGDYFNNLGNPLIHTWSLSVEEQIYFFLPILMFMSLNRQKVEKIIINNIKFMLATITFLSLVIFMLPSILQNIYNKIGISDYNHFNFYSPIHRIWQFTIGGLCFFYIKNQNFKQRERLRLINRLLVLFFLVLLIGPTSLEPRLASFFASLMTLLIIYFRSLDSIPKNLILPFKWLGDRSYSIYLFHLPLIFIAKSSPYLTQQNLSKFFVLAAVLLSVFLGALSHSRIENRYRIRHISAVRVKIPTNIITAFLIPCLLISLFMINGSTNNYWGLAKKPIQPIFAVNPEKNCDIFLDKRDHPCIFKDKDAVNTVLLIGDSHASEFSQAVIDASKSANWNSAIWTLPSCNFLLNNENGKISPTCLERNKLILKWIEENRPKLVILSQYNRSELPQSEMLSSVLTMKKLASNILIIGNTPIFGDSRYMATPALFQKKYEAPKYLPISKMDKSQIAVSNAFLTSVKTKDIKIVDLNYLWCNLAYCNRFNDNGWLFSDPSHLSLAGADMSVPYFIELLNDL